MRRLAYCELLVLLLVGYSSAQPSCSTQKNNLDKVETSCSHLGLTAVPLKGIPADTQILILSFNSLKSVSTSSFKGFKQLVELDLSNNGMSAITVDLPLNLEVLNLAYNSFKELPKLSQLKSLVKLDLSNNRIETVPDDAFHGMQQLKSLYLRANVIPHLTDKVFEGLTQLETLDLSFNELREVPNHLIYDLVQMAKFHLSGNRLTEIPDLFFKGLERLSYVYLDQNPWNCNCALVYFKEWVEDNEDNIYIIENGTLVNDVRSILCNDTLSLLDYSMEHCHSAGDTGPSVAKTPFIVEREPPTEAPTTAAWHITTPGATEAETTSLETTNMPTMEAQTTSLETTKLPTTAQTTSLETKKIPTTKALTTSLETTNMPTMEAQTTSLKTTKRPTTKAQTTSLETTKIPTTESLTTSLEATWAKTTTAEHTSHKATQLPTTEVVEVSTRHTTAKELIVTTPDSTPSPTTSRWTRPPSTRPVPQTTMATSLHPATQTPAAAEIDAPVAPVAMKHWRTWLVETIIRHCCFLHFLLYMLIVGGLVFQIVVCLWLLAWGYTSYQMYFQILTRKRPGVRLTRYSQRISTDEDEILLVRDGNGGSTFRDGTGDEPVPMLMLEARPRDHGRRFTSAILS